MPRSKNITDYFEIKLSQLVADRELTFELNLYFSRSNHIVLWRKTGERPDGEFLARYAAKGLSRLWVHNDDRTAFEKYLNPPEPAAPEPPPPEAVKIVEALKSPDLSDEQKAEAVAAQARETLRETAAAETLPAQQEANRQARRIVQQILESFQSEAQTSANEIWKISNIDPCFVHSVNVATYAVLFALAFGRIDISLMTDLALAALLHDIGLSQVDAELACLPFQQMTASQISQYSRHVDASVVLAQAHGIGISPRVKVMLEQHHEKFDGTGYPKKLQGFHLDDVAQLLAMAELLESVCAGHWDGTPRTLGDALDTMEALEKARTFPAHFNPDVFSAVMRWTRSDQSASATREALNLVKTQTQKFVQSAS